jgi:hypothetical protein
MPDEMDTLLAIQRSKLAAEERELLIKRARGTPSVGAMLFLISGLACLAIGMGLSMAFKSAPLGGLLFVGLINMFVGYHRMSNERVAAVIALLDEDKHGPKEAWIRRLQRPPETDRR